MDLRFHFLESPRRLSCLVMPREARIAAAQKISQFRDGQCTRLSPERSSQNGRQGNPARAGCQIGGKR